MYIERIQRCLWTWEAGKEELFYRERRDDAVTEALGEDTREAVMLIAPPEYEDMLRTLLESIPEGYRPATNDDRAGEKPAGTRVRGMDGCWIPACLSEPYIPGHLYIVPENIPEKDRTIRLSNGAEVVLSVESWNNLKRNIGS
jgi:hypothetical protein